MERKLFGRLDGGEEIYVYTLRSGEYTAEIINYGAAIKSFSVSGTDAIGGYPELLDYVTDNTNQGATVGRVANRIDGAVLNIDGAIYMLTDNEGGACLHGGEGFHRRVWNIDGYSDSSVTLSYYSPDGEDGFPAGLRVTLKYTLLGGALIMEYEAVPEGKTAIALTNHSHFNLSGFKSDVLSHRVTIFADRYTEIDGRRIPTGERPEVSATRFDFRESHEIGERGEGGECGYDHNFILSPELFCDFGTKRLPLCAVAEGELLRLEVYTDQPGLQFYTGNFLSGGPRLFGTVEKTKHRTFCLEAQTEPDCVSHGIGIYDAGERYLQTTVYKISKI